MAKINKIHLIYDRAGNSLNVWFDDPKKEYVCEETGKEVILAKDKKGKVIGFEKLNFLPRGRFISKKTLPVKTLVT